MFGFFLNKLSAHILWSFGPSFQKSLEVAIGRSETLAVTTINIYQPFAGRRSWHCDFWQRTPILIWCLSRSSSKNFSPGTLNNHHFILLPLNKWLGWRDGAMRRTLEYEGKEACSCLDVIRHVTPCSKMWISPDELFMFSDSCLISPFDEAKSHKQTRMFFGWHFFECFALN